MGPEAGYFFEMHGEEGVLLTLRGATSSSARRTAPEGWSAYLTCALPIGGK